jgi:hypothetical protein
VWRLLDEDGFIGYQMYSRRKKEDEAIALWNDEIAEGKPEFKNREGNPPQSNVVSTSAHQSNVVSTSGECSYHIN